MNVGGYQILRKLGEGAFGKVYLARKDAASGFRAYYAVKRLRAEHLEEAEGIEEYLHREARLGGIVNHPALVRIHEVVQHAGEFALVMDYVDGITLRRILRRRRGEPLPREVVLEVGAGVLDALHYVHTLRDPEGNATGFIHRDVKPGNVMLTAQGQLKLMDFGVARLEDEARTLAGELRGTIAYMAPEQARGEPVSAATDQFACGLLILEMATGRRAWGDGNAAGVLARVIAGDVSSAMLRLEATDPLAEILARMLQPDPGDRYPDAAAAAHALRVQRAALATPPALAQFATEEIEGGRTAEDTIGHEGAPSWTNHGSLEPALVSWSEESDPIGGPVSLTGGVVRDEGPGPDIFPDDLELDPAPASAEALVAPAPDPEPQRAALEAATAALEQRLGDVDPAQTLPLGPGMVIPDIDLGDPETGSAPRPPPVPAPPVVPADATLPIQPSSLSQLPALRRPPGPPPQPAPPVVVAAPPSAIPAAVPPPVPRRRKKQPPPTRLERFLSSKPMAVLVTLLLLAALAGATWAVLDHGVDEFGARGDAPEDDLADARAEAEPPKEFDLDQVPEDPPPSPTSSAEAAAPVPAPEPTPRAAPVSDAPPREGDPAPAAAPSPQDAPGADDPGAAEPEGQVEAPEPTPALVEGQIVGRPPPDELSEYRKVDRAGEATPAAADDDGVSVAALKFLSAREQPLGVPLVVRVRPTGFQADAVAVYYQWRSEGSSGRRKRTLSPSGADFTLQLAVRELRQDRLQLWFVAEPGEVTLGSSGDPIEVRVR